MTELILESFLDAGMDTLKLLPFLFVTYLAMEALEKHAQDPSCRLIKHETAGKLSPVFGALVGVIPQCGFSASASSLYAAGLISLGTLLTVFLSTSDEMLPLLLSSRTNLGTILRILAAKALIGMVSGLFIDLVMRHLFPTRRKEKSMRDLCEEEHCRDDKEQGILHACLVHTVHIVVFVFLITMLLNLLVEGFGEDMIRSFLCGRSIMGVFITAAVGLIPNCAASIIITQLYLDSLIGAGQMMAGLLVGGGVGLLVLFRTNRRHPKENLCIAAILYVLGVFFGLLTDGLGISF